MWTIEKVEKLREDTAKPCTDHLFSTSCDYCFMISQAPEIIDFLLAHVEGLNETIEVMGEELSER